MNKKRLLFLTVAFNTGGTEKATFDIISNLNPEKYDITLMTMYNGGFYQSLLPEYVHVKYFFPRFIRFAIRYVTLFPAKLVYRTFVHDKYDVEIACGDDIPSRVINHSPNKHSKKFAWIHMDVVKRGYAGLGMKTAFGRRRFYRNFDRIVNVSKECERKFQEKFGNALPTCTIYNAVPVESIRQAAQLTPALALPEDCFNIVAIGRFTPQKGFDRLIDAYAKVKELGCRKCRITILGDGQDREMLESKIHGYGLEDDIVMPGFVGNPHPVLKQADLFLLSSRDESFSLVVAEAMVLGIPVMSTRCTGPVELLKDGEAGYLVENSTEGIYRGLCDILRNDDAYECMCRKAAANTDNFDLSEQISQIEALLDEESCAPNRH